MPSRLLLPRLQKMTPYVPGEQPRDLETYVKINTNECPYPPAPSVVSAAKAASDTVNRYPDPTCKALISAIAEEYGVKDEQVYVGNGSDEVLGFSFMAFCDEAHPVQYANITYGFYDVYARLLSVPARVVPLNDDFSVPVDQFLHCGRNIYLANPNAPTGIALPKDTIEEIVRQNSSNLVVIDEAYVDFGAETALPLINKYDNLLIIRTYSKSRAMAGARLGYALGHPDLIAAMNLVKHSFHPYCINNETMAMGIAAMRDREYFQNCVGKIIKTREQTAQALSDMGFVMTDSKANFLFAGHPHLSGKTWYEELKKRKVLVRYFSQEEISSRVRISVGTDEQMAVFLAQTKEILKEQDL